MQHLLERKADLIVVTTWHLPATALGRPPEAGAPTTRTLRRGVKSADRPPGENLRELLHIQLRVAAVNAERVQLEQLARVVFVQAALLAAAAAGTRSRRARTDRLKVVEIHEHRGMLRRRQHHVGKTAEYVGANRLAFVTAGERRDENLRAHRHTEVVRPERDEALDERTFGRHAFDEGGSAFCRGDCHQAPACFLPGRAALLIVALGCVTERANGVANRFWRSFGGYLQERRVTLELGVQPAARIARSSAVAGPRAEAEAVEGTKRGIHLLNYRTELARFPFALDGVCHRIFINSRFGVLIYRGATLP